MLSYVRFFTALMAIIDFFDLISIRTIAYNRVTLSEMLTVNLLPKVHCPIGFTMDNDFQKPQNLPFRLWLYYKL